MRKLFLPAMLALLIAGPLTAQNNGRLLDQPMKLKSLDIKVDADLFTATTFIEMEFYNPNDREEEGLFLFELKPGQAITGFQLDLNGKFRDGTIEEKWKARNAYNSIVGKRVDPALLQMDYYNHYRLNIYPLPAKGTRRVTLTIQQVMARQENSLKYFLPLNIQQEVEHFKMLVTVNNSSLLPFTNEGMLAKQVFKGTNRFHQLAYKDSLVKADKALAFTIPLENNVPVLCSKQVNGRTFFALRTVAPGSKNYTIHPKKITVFWDVSVNGEKRNTKKEISFLRRFAEVNDISQVTIITFSHVIHDTAIFYTGKGFNSRWTDYLAALKYEGATQLGLLNFSNTEADLVFLFSDGKNTYGADLPVQGTTHVFCVHAGAANQQHLQKIVGITGGRHINLDETETEEAVRLAGQADNVLLNIRTDRGDLSIDQDWLSLQLSKQLLITGSFDGEASTLYLDFGNRISGGVMEKIPLKKDCRTNALERMTALTFFDSCIRQYNWQLMLEFGKREAMVTPYTSYIVLEKIEDYIRYNIKPPKELESECDMNIFVKADKVRRQQYQKMSESDMLNRVVQTYNQRLSWWNRNEEPILLTTPDINSTVTAQKDAGKDQNTDKGKASPTQTSAVIQSPVIEPGANVVTGTEVVVTALGQTRQPKELGYSMTRVRSAELVQAAPVNMQQGLTGKVSGLNVQTVNNGVFADTRITLRGIRSLTGNNQPMLILDGTPIALGYLSSINPNDVQDVTILKSASATAIYGPDGVNGALIVNTKKGRRTGYYYSDKPYKLEDCEDVDYMKEMRGLSRSEKLATYLKLKADYQDNAGFYFDMAQLLFEAGFTREAVRILFSAAGVSNGNKATIRAIGFTLENWKKFDEAIKVYTQLLQSDSIEIRPYRDLALAHYQAGHYQQAVDLFYKAITHDFGDRELNFSEWKSTLLQEMNAIIALHRGQLDLSAVNAQLIRPLPVDLRIVVDCNKDNIYNNISVIEPGKQTVSALQPTQNDNRFMKALSYHNWYGYSYYPVEYQAKQAKEGKYTVRVNYSDYYWYYEGVQVPTFIRVVTFKNFGTAGQSMSIENVIMDNQWGNVDIAETRWQE